MLVAENFCDFCKLASDHIWFPTTNYLHHTVNIHTHTTCILVAASDAPIPVFTSRSDTDTF